MLLEDGRDPERGLDITKNIMRDAERQLSNRP